MHAAFCLTALGLRSAILMSLISLICTVCYTTKSLVLSLSDWPDITRFNKTDNENKTADTVAAVPHVESEVARL